jgi:hypothetical protein
MHCFQLNNVLYSRSSLNRLIFIVSDKTDYKEFISFENEYVSTATSSVGIRNQIEIDLTLTREVPYEFETKMYYNIVVEPKKHCPFSNRIVYTIRQIGISDIQYEPCENDDASDSEQILDEEEIYIVQEELCEKIRRSIDSFSERAKLLKKLLKTCSSKNMANISILHDALEKTTQLEF